MVSGEMQLGYSMNAQENVERADNLRTPMGVPDCVVFFLTVSSIDADFWVTKVAGRIHEVTIKGMSVIIVFICISLTKL